MSRNKPLVFILAMAVALLITALPLPHWLMYWRPDFVALLMIYWSRRLSATTCIWIAFFLGILLDVLLVSRLGLHALSLVLLVFGVRFAWRRLAMLPSAQLSASIFGILILYLILNRVLLSWVGAAPDSWFLYWMPAITSALLWPRLNAFLNKILGER